MAGEADGGEEAIRALLARKIKRERGRKLLSALDGEVSRLFAVFATAAAAGYGAGRRAAEAKLSSCPSLTHTHTHTVLYLCASASSGSRRPGLSAISPYETPYLLDIIATATKKIIKKIKNYTKNVKRDEAIAFFLMQRSKVSARR